jgi:hypothetical protein
MNQRRCFGPVQYKITQKPKTLNMKAYKATVLVAALNLGACSFGTESLWPALTGDDAPMAESETVEREVEAEAQSEASQDYVAIDSDAKAEVTATENIADVPLSPQNETNGALSLGTTNFIMPSVTPGQPTGTYVGQQIEQLRAELVRLQGVITERNEVLQNLRDRAIDTAQRYHGTVGGVEARLQTGTTPGNPILVNQWKSAQLGLERVATDIGFMQRLANEVAADSALSQFLLEKANSAKGLQGAIDDDHVQINVLQDETSKTVVIIERLLTELSEDIRRQTSYVANERGNLQTLALAITRGELYGSSLANRAVGASEVQAATGPSLAQQSTRQRLVVIQFDTTDVAYEQALYTALAGALERKPDARFDIVSIAPGAGAVTDKALSAQNTRRYADQVRRSMSNMGLPGDRMSMSTMTSQSKLIPEVQVFVR